MSATIERPTQAIRSYPSHSRGPLPRLLLTREVAIIAALVLVYAWSWLNVAYFDSPLTLFNLFRDNAAILLIALPMTLVIITGEIDLSVSSTLAVSAAVTGVLVKDYGMSVPAAALIALLVGLLLGALNGVLVAYAGSSRRIGLRPGHPVPQPGVAEVGAVAPPELHDPLPSGVVGHGVAVARRR